MSLRHYLILFFFATLFLFYPGDSYYVHLFMYNRQLFATQETKKSYSFTPFPASQPYSAPLLTATSAYVVDLPTFTPIFELNIHEKLFPASTAKIITALVAYDIYKPDQVITIKNVLNDGQVMGLVPGEKITVENLLYGTLVHSGNDAAYALADAYGFDKFETLMNKKAKSLLMKDSYFTNPAGLDNNNQYTTAFDLALAGRELLANTYLAKIASTKEITISDTDYLYFHQLTNVNKLLGEVQGIGGLKTGYTENAGENLVSFYKKQGHEFIIVILKSEDRFSDTKNVVKWLDESIQYVTP